MPYYLYACAAVNKIRKSFWASYPTLAHTERIALDIAFSSFFTVQNITTLSSCYTQKAWMKFVTYTRKTLAFQWPLIREFYSPCFVNVKNTKCRSARTEIISFASQYIFCNSNEKSASLIWWLMKLIFLMLPLMSWIIFQLKSPI